MHCTCGKSTCPNSQNCVHCMCEMQPNFGRNQTISWGGAIYQVCCKCGYRLHLSGPTDTSSYKWDMGSDSVKARL